MYLWLVGLVGFVGFVGLIYLLAAILCTHPVILCQSGPLLGPGRDHDVVIKGDGASILVL